MVRKSFHHSLMILHHGNFRQIATGMWASWLLDFQSFCGAISNWQCEDSFSGSRSGWWRQISIELWGKFHTRTSRFVMKNANFRDTFPRDSKNEVRLFRHTNSSINYGLHAHTSWTNRKESLSLASDFDFARFDWPYRLSLSEVGPESGLRH